MKRLFWIAAAVITYWQIRAGIARCGTLDGGVLVLPLLLLTAYLARGVYRDLTNIFGRDTSGRETTSSYRQRHIRYC